jgi:hypothetical protein
MNKTAIISKGTVAILLFMFSPFALGQVIPENPSKGASSL